MGQDSAFGPSEKQPPLERARGEEVSTDGDRRLVRLAAAGVAAACGALVAVRPAGGVCAWESPEVLGFAVLFLIAGGLSLGFRQVSRATAVALIAGAPLLAACLIVVFGQGISAASSLLFLHVLVVGLLAPEAVVLCVVGLFAWFAIAISAATTRVAATDRPFYVEPDLVLTAVICATALALLVVLHRRSVARFAALEQGFASSVSERARGLVQDAMDARELAAEGDAMYQQVLETATDAMLLQDHERQQTINALVETSRDWIWAIDLEGRLTFSNGAVREILGYDPAELLGQVVFRFIEPEDGAVLRELMAGRSSPGSGWRSQLVKWMHKSGKVHYLESSAMPILGVGGDLQGFRGVDRDVTERIDAEQERRHLEEQIRQGQKLEAVGALAGGVAHDFNNILQAILGSASIARIRAPVNSECVGELIQIERATARAAELTRHLLAFSRQQVLERRVVAVDELMTSVLAMVRRVIGEDIALEFTSGADSARVHADPGQLEQVVLNLCVNARDALPCGGRIRVETAEVELGGEFCAGHPGIVPGRFIRITVADDGIGMDAATVKQIFDPFFTTKAPGRGTGLGLSTVYGIVKQHGGAIEVRSRVGDGASFGVYFPATDAPVVDKAAVEATPVPGGTETILVAEDDDQVRDVAVRLLESGGYTVLAARDGEVALRLLSEHGHSLDLLLLDLIMPKVSGPDIELGAATLAPRAKVVFTTGYAAAERLERLIVGRERNVLIKPYGRRQLLTKIREVLDAT